MNDNHNNSYVNRILFTFVAVVILTASMSAQETGSIAAIKANLRGTPSTTGIVVTTLVQGEDFELIKDKAPWYLIQTSKYVGWIHGNSIRFGETADSFAEAYVREMARPKTTTKPVSDGDSPFQTEYVGGETTTLRIHNQTDRILTLNFGGVKYTFAPTSEREMEVDGGRYEFSASVPRAHPTSGVGEFQKGRRYTWKFFIVRR
jgi:hypothetical protein